MDKPKRKFSTIRSSAEVLDSTLDSMEETRFRKRNKRLAIKLSRKLHFSFTEIECLLLIYYKLQRDSKDSKYGIDKTQFRDILHCGFDMTDDYLMDRIFYTLDKGLSGSVMSMESWVTHLSLFLKGTLEERMKYCFMVYDSNDTKMLGRGTIFKLLRYSFLSLSGEEDAEETAKEFMDEIIKKMDLDRDGKISYTDFKQCVRKQPMLLEVFGQCLPGRRNVHTFVTTYARKTPKM